jgi:uncharacterized membrane protein
MQTSLARTRVAVGLACGAVAALAVAWFVPWQATVLVAWDVAALVVLIRIWTRVRNFDGAGTRTHAMIDDNTRASADFLLLLAAASSLVGVGFAFFKANERGGAEEVLLEGLGIATIAISWFIVHTTYMLRYAHLYYSDPVGGIDFKTRADDPDYRDFAYVAFTVGMTYQVSDTDVKQREMRRAIMRHALLSFLFGAVILAAAVNVIASLLNS